MPNGKPGDHPLTDLLSYGKCTLPDWMCAMVLEIHALRPTAFDEEPQSAPFDWNEYRRVNGDWFSWASGERLDEALDFLEQKLKDTRES